MPIQNLVLCAALPVRPSSRFNGLKRVAFDVGRQFWKKHENLSQVLFRLDGVLSLQISAAPFKKVEIGMVGRKGFAGVPVSLGEPKARTALVALTSREAAVMPRKMFEGSLRRAAFHDSASRYVRSFVNMVARISVCNRVHVIEDLCVARLLMMQDRTRANTFQVTQDFLCRLLGVRRAAGHRPGAPGNVGLFLLPHYQGRFRPPGQCPGRL